MNSSVVVCTDTSFQLTYEYCIPFCDCDSCFSSSIFGSSLKNPDGMSNTGAADVALWETVSLVSDSEPYRTTSATLQTAP